MKYLLKEVKANVSEAKEGTQTPADPLYEKYENLHDSDLFIDEKISQKSQSSQQNGQSSLSPYKYSNAKRQKSVKIYKSPGKDPATP